MKFFYPILLCAVLIVPSKVWAKFSPAVSYPAGSYPSSIVTGDFNNDNNLDLVVTNFITGNTISVLLGVGDGTFAAPVSYVSGNQSFYLITGDFNNDNNLDIAMARRTDNNLSILLGNGDGTFQSVTEYSLGGSESWSLSAADFNNDDNLDLAVVNFNENTTSVILGNGDGTFGTVTDYPTGTIHSRGITTGDFNDDGNKDIAIGEDSGNHISILLGMGDGTFSIPTVYTTGVSENESDLITSVLLITADFNNDNNLDLVSANENGNNISVLLGSGDGTFATATTYDTGDFTASVAYGDFNNDNNLDLVATNADGNNISVLYGIGNGVFDKAVNYSVGITPFFVTNADFNNDGKLDIAVANLQDNNVSLLLNIEDSVPSEVKNLFINSVSNTQAELSWSPPLDHGGRVITDYIIEYKASTDSDWNIFNDGISTQLSVVVTGLTNDMNYDFRVAAVNSIGTGEYAGATTSPLVVNSLLDDGDGTCTEEKCTFRDAVANSVQGNTIEFGGLTGTILLNIGDVIVVDHNLVITGPGADLLTIDFNGGNNNKYIEYTHGNLAISNLSITNGSYTIYQNGGDGDFTLSNMIFRGNTGGPQLYLYGEGNVTITNTQFIENTANDDSGSAIYMSGNEGNGNLTITNSLFSGNTSIYNGGAIYLEKASRVTITNSTFVDNSTSSDNGGAIALYGDIPVSITNSTFSNNTASTGGAFYVAEGEVTITNSIFSGTDTCAVDTGTITSLGYNIDSGTSCGFAETGDLSSTDPLLDPSGPHDNGGPVPTIALLEGSPAINAGDDETAPDTDARGFARVGVSDIGAYEYGSTPPDTTPPSTIITPLGSFPTTDTSSSFILTADEPATFECSLDEASFTSCTASYTTPILAVGTHTLAVRAIDVSNNTDVSPAIFSWDIIRRPSGGGGGGGGSYNHIYIPTTPITNTPPTTLPIKSYHFIRTLKYGFNGIDVKELQKYLNTHGYLVSLSGAGSLGHETSYFGISTKKALIKFQKAHRLVPDGIAGKKTYVEMK
jgi:predicted outer membrane repeat protein